MKVRHIVAVGDAIVPFLVPNMIADADVPIDQFVQNIRNALTFSPQFIRVMASLGTCFQCEGEGKVIEKKDIKEGEKTIERIIEKICPTCGGSSPEEQLHGFAIAYAPEGMQYVYIAQCWVHPKASAEHLAELYFQRIRAWAESMQKRSIRMETSRDPKGFMRKWKFRHLSTTMQFDLTTMEVPNGQVERSEIGVDIDEESADAERSVGQLSESGDDSGRVESEQSDRSGSDALRGTDSAKSDPAVSAGADAARADSTAESIGTDSRPADDRPSDSVAGISSAA